MWGTILTLLTSGAGGGIVGGVLALFRTAGERKERLELASLELKRDQAEYQDRRDSEKYELSLLDQKADSLLKQTETEGEIAAEVAGLDALKVASKTEFEKLNTSTWVDNIRALIRPMLALWFTLLFNIVLFWAFSTYKDLLTPNDGKEILMGLFVTLNFVVNSVVSFYYVSRANSQKRI